MRTFHSIQAARIGINIIHAKTQYEYYLSLVVEFHLLSGSISALATCYLYIRSSTVT